MNQRRETQIKKYGGLEGYKAEMARRRALVINPYSHFKNPANAKLAAQKRWKNVQDQTIPS